MEVPDDVRSNIVGSLAFCVKTFNGEILLKIRMLFTSECRATATEV
jgi:hypothetical protein